MANNFIDKFMKAKVDTKMNPQLAFVVSILYMIASDGVIQNEEIGQLLAVLGGEEGPDGQMTVGDKNERLLRSAQAYVEKHDVHQFLEETTPLLNDVQKMSILVNICDSLLSDGKAEAPEQKLFGAFMKSFGISEERFQPFFEVLILKNDRTVFSFSKHPKCREGYKVKLVA